MVNTVKFSEFATAPLTNANNEVVGLESGVNVQSVRFLNWTTAGRPATPFNGLLGINTTLQQYEFWDAVANTWTQLSDTNIFAILASHAAGQGASLIGLQDQSNVTSKTVQDLANAAFIAQTDNGSLQNAQFLEALSTGIVKNATGTGVLSISAPLTSIDGLTTVANNLLYTTAPNVYAVIAPGNNGVLITSAGGVPSISSTLPSAVQTNITALGAQAQALNMNTHLINNVVNPVAAQDAATKSYVDSGVAGAVLLTPSGNQVITAFTLQVAAGRIFSGSTSGGTSGGLVMYPSTAANGSLIIHATDSPANFSMQITNAPCGQPTVWTIPDPVNNFANFIISNFSGQQHITSGSLAVDTASLISGISTGGFAGRFIGFSPTAALGSISVIAADNGGNFANTLTHASTGAARTWTLPDATGTIALTSDLTGFVTSVSGTANRITSTGGTTPVIDISGSYVGQASITTLGTIGTGVWQGTVVAGQYGGTGVNNGSNTATFAGNLNFANSFTTIGNFAVTQTYTGATNVTFPTSGTLATTSQLPTGAALTKTDDTNVTLTLGGTPATALLQATSLTLGWTGQLSLARGGTNANLTASNGGIVYSSATALAILAGTATANQVLLSGSSTTPAWSTATYPATTTANQLLYSSSNNVIAGLATANSSVLVTSAGGVPSLSTTLPAGLTIPGYALSGANSDITSMTGLTGTLRAPTGVTSSAGANLLGFTYTGSAVNYFGFTSNTTGNNPLFQAIGSDTNITLQLAGSGTGGVLVQGTGTNNNALPGYVGEEKESVVANSTASLTSNTNADVTSLSLTAGDWDVWGNVTFAGNASTSVIINLGWISTTSATLPTSELYANQFYSTVGVLVYSIGPTSFCVPSIRLSLSATTTVYLSVRSAFTVSTTTAGGGIYARRVR